MSLSATIFFLFNAIFLLALPKNLVPLPLLISSCYMTLGQGIELYPFHFTIIRLIIAVGFFRIVIRGENFIPKLETLDFIMIFWAGWALLSSFFHKDPTETLIFHLGLVYNILGIYLLIRTYCQSMQGILTMITFLAILLVPIAVEMVNEQITGRNMFSVFGGVPEASLLRDGKIRAQGPFGHPILAGTVGAVCVPLMVGLWKTNKHYAIAGVVACITMVICSRSSGPIVSMMTGALALYIWRYRHYTKQMRYMAVVCYILLDIVMKAPAYYLMARLDFTGSSTGYYRASLIESSIKHLSEWWFAGTDYTRHWMVTGVRWSPDHADITNYYIKMGVLGGLPLMMLLMWALWTAFKYVGIAAKDEATFSEKERYVYWTIGASLFGHATTCLSVSYFDQSFVFLFACLAMTVPHQKVYLEEPFEILRRESEGMGNNTPEVAV